MPESDRRFQAENLMCFHYTNGAYPDRIPVSEPRGSLSDPGGIRTHTVSILSAVPLPLGYRAIIPALGTLPSGRNIVQVRQRVANSFINRCRLPHKGGYLSRSGTVANC